MDQSIENKTEIKNRIINFFNRNKTKTYILIFVLVMSLILSVYSKVNNERQNIKIAEKYVEAGLYLTSNKKDIAKSLYEEIILSDNEIYSILALNTVIEKNLISDKDKILRYFDILKKSITAKDQQDLIIFKEALYFLKISDIEKGNKLLNYLIDNDSILKPTVEELLRK